MTASGPFEIKGGGELSRHSTILSALAIPLCFFFFVSLQWKRDIHSCVSLALLEDNSIPLFPAELLCQHIPYSLCVNPPETSFSFPGQDTTLTANKYGEGAEESTLVEEKAQNYKVGCKKTIAYVCIVTLYYRFTHALNFLPTHIKLGGSRQAGWPRGWGRAIAAKCLNHIIWKKSVAPIPVQYRPFTIQVIFSYTPDIVYGQLLTLENIVFTHGSEFRQPHNYLFFTVFWTGSAINCI